MGKKIAVEHYLPLLSNTLIELSLNPVARNDRITISGSLLFADLSGFTAMSEKLAALGRAGGERLAQIINGCFDPLLDIVEKYNGDIIKFGGDAFLALFERGEHARIACLCGIELINWVNENGLISTPVGEFKLGIHAGVSTGDIYNLDIGGTKGHREHLFCGETVEQAYAAADMAELGQLAVTVRTAECLHDDEKIAINERYFFCKPPLHIPKDIDRLKSFRKDTGQMKNPGDYIITNLDSLLESNQGRIEGEHRIITNLFIGINSLRANLEDRIERAIPAVNYYFAAINEIIEKHQGVIARLDSSSSSEKMLVFFGAPKSSGQDTQNCLRAVLEIESRLAELNKNFAVPIKHRYGVNTGLCFVGAVGGSKRYEYTAMGDAINLAARLMGKAEYGEILVGEQTIKIAGKGFATTDYGEITVKGKREPVHVYRLSGETVNQIENEEMIGREDEYKQAQAFIREIKDRRKSYLLIYGEAGAGKSLFCSKTIALAQQSGIHIARGNCYKHAGLTPYEPIKEALQSLLGLSDRAAVKQRRMALSEYLKSFGESEWEPLLAPLFGYSLPIPPQLMTIPEEIKKSKTQEIICRLVVEVNRKKVSLLIFDDAQWIDSASYELIKALMAAPNSPAIIFITRPGDICDNIKTLVSSGQIELGPLTEPNARKLFLWALDGIIPEEQIIQRAIEKSGGNPFYLEELAKAFKELGPERFASGENIPAGIESVITARIDNLGETVKKTLRAASVIGRVFAFKALCALFDNRNYSTTLRKHLEELNQLDLTPLERRQPILEYIFKHILTQEVAYNGLSYTSRQALHLKAADYFAGQPRFCRNHPELPARHYLLAGQDLKALPYLYDAAVKAAGQFANKEAISHFTSAIEIARKYDDINYLVKSTRGRGNLAKQTSDYGGAIADFIWIKENAVSVDDKIDALKNLAEIYRITNDYERSDGILDELLDTSPDNPSVLAFCHNSRAEILRRKGKLPAARAILAEAEKVIRSGKVNADIQATVYNHLGICLWSMGNLAESVEYYKKALTLYRKLKDLNGQSKVINNLGIISDKMGKLDRATRAYQKAEKIFQRIGATRSQACACANLGTIYGPRGLFSGAISKIMEAMQIFERIGDQRAYAFAIGDLGYTYYAMGEYDSAESHFKKAIDLGKRLADDEFTLENEMRLARLYLLLDKPLNISVDELIKKAEEVGALELKVKSRLIGCWQQLNRGDFKGLKDSLAKIVLYQGLDDFPEIIIELAKLQTISKLKEGERSEAIAIFKKAVKNSLNRNLAIHLGELVVIGRALQIYENIPTNVKNKIETVLSRLDGAHVNTAFHQFRLQIENKIVGAKQSAGILCEPRDNNKIPVEPLFR